uniref:Putative monocarboxylate transporter n=1 Tax=Ixodes ricinus TaxID=34613 RepID=A0A0K8RHW5_IXORI
MAALCFIVTLLFMCIFRPASLLYPSFMTTFQVSRGEASLPICIFGGFMNLSGLVSGPMIHSFGIRSVAIFGGLMMSIGCIVSVFATGITFLVFSLGLISGFFRDTYGSYDGLMRGMGGMILMSFFFTAGLWLSDPIKKKKFKLDTAGTAVANDNVSQTVKM